MRLVFEVLRANYSICFPPGNRSASTSSVARSSPRRRAPSLTPRLPRSSVWSLPSASSTSATVSHSSAARPRRSRTRPYVTPNPQKGLSLELNTNKIHRTSTPRFWPSVLPRAKPPRPMPASAVPLPCTRLRLLAFDENGFGCDWDTAQGFRWLVRFIKWDRFSGTKMDEAPKRSYAMIVTFIFQAFWDK